jgi:hypothetical protein
MSIIVLLPFLALLGLVVVFIVAYKKNGLKTALLTTGITLIVFLILYSAVILIIANPKS